MLNLLVSAIEFRSLISFCRQTYDIKNEVKIPFIWFLSNDKNESVISEELICYFDGVKYSISLR